VVRVHPQVGVNVQLGIALGHGLRSAFWSFFIALAVIWPFSYTGPSYKTSLRAARSGPWYMWFAGPMGAFYVASSILLTPAMGVSLYFIFVVLGSLAASIVIDHTGLLGFPVRQTSLLRASGVALVLAGSVLAQDFSGTKGSEAGLVSLYSFIAFIAGALLPLQAALNGMRTRQMGSTLKSAVVSFSTGVIALAIAAAITFVWTEWRCDISGVDDIPKLVAGVVSSLYVLSGIAIPPLLGFAPFFILMISGQLLASLVVDHLGAFSFQQKSATALRIIAVTLSITGGAMANIASYRAVLVDRKRVEEEKAASRRASLASTEAEAVGADGTNGCVATVDSTSTSDSAAAAVPLDLRTSSMVSDEPVYVVTHRTAPSSPRDLQAILRAYEAVVDANIAASVYETMAYDSRASSSDR